MKYTITIVLYIFIINILCFYAQSLNQLLLIEQYIYTGVCSSFNNFEIESSHCENNTLYSKSIIKLSECTVFQMQPALFKYDSDTKEIIQLIYSDQVCTNYVDSKTHTIGSCNTTCLYGQGLTFKMQIVNDYDLPNSAIISILYKNKKCDNNYKNTFIEIDYQYLNFCQAYYNTDPSYSVKTICNETYQTNYVYSNTNCNGTPTIEHFPIVNQCDIANIPQLHYFQICNN